MFGWSIAMNQGIAFSPNSALLKEVTLGALKLLSSVFGK